MQLCYYGPSDGTVPTDDTDVMGPKNQEKDKWGVAVVFSLLPSLSQTQTTI